MKAIVCMDQNGTIGIDGKIPWHYTEDLKHFKELTQDSPVLMGRKTFDEIYEKLGTGLPNRVNLVITSKPLPEPKSNEILVQVSPNDFNTLRDSSDIWVIGGENVYREFEENLDYIYTTKINKTINHAGTITKFPVNLDRFKLIETKQGETPELEFCIYKHI